MVQIKSRYNLIWLNLVDLFWGFCWDKFLFDNKRYVNLENNPQFAKGPSSQKQSISKMVSTKLTKEFPNNSSLSLNVGSDRTNKELVKFQDFCPYTYTKF